MKKICEFMQAGEMELKLQIPILCLLVLLLNMSSGMRPVRVGLVLDMDNYMGQMGSQCIEMALSDFYAAHEHYETRLLLSHRDSKLDILGAASAGNIHIYIYIYS